MRLHLICNLTFTCTLPCPHFFFTIVFAATMLKPSSRDPVYQPIHFWGFFGLQVASALRSPMELARLKIQDLKIDNRKNYYEPAFQVTIVLSAVFQVPFCIASYGKMLFGPFAFFGCSTLSDQMEKISHGALLPVQYLVLLSLNLLI